MSCMHLRSISYFRSCQKCAYHTLAEAALCARVATPLPLRLQFLGTLDSAARISANPSLVSRDQSGRSLLPTHVRMCANETGDKIKGARDPNITPFAWCFRLEFNKLPPSCLLKFSGRIDCTEDNLKKKKNSSSPCAFFEHHLCNKQISVFLHLGIIT